VKRMREGRERGRRDGAREGYYKKKEKSGRR
jgi:hypothetical protein